MPLFNETVGKITELEIHIKESRHTDVEGAVLLLVAFLSEKRCPVMRMSHRFTHIINEGSETDIEESPV